MSDLVFPHLPGQAVKVGYEPTYSTTIHTSPSGKEQRTSWRAAARKRYSISYGVLRNATSAPSPYQANSETGVIIAFLEQHRGAWDSFLFSDPMSGASVRVRLEEDSLKFEQVVPGIWELSSLALIEVL